MWSQPIKQLSINVTDSDYFHICRLHATSSAKLPDDNEEDVQSIPSAG